MGSIYTQDMNSPLTARAAPQRLLRQKACKKLNGANQAKIYQWLGVYPSLAKSKQYLELLLEEQTTGGVRCWECGGRCMRRCMSSRWTATDNLFWEGLNVTSVMSHFQQFKIWRNAREDNPFSWSLKRVRWLAIFQSLMSKKVKALTKWRKFSKMLEISGE